MTQRSDYTVYLFDRFDDYIGTYQDAPFSKARSYDIYFKDKFVFGDRLPSKLRKRQKQYVIRQVLKAIIEKKELEKLKKKGNRKFRQAFYSLPDNFDIQLFGSNGRRVKASQLSKAKFFRLLFQTKSGQWEKVGDWEFPNVSMRIDDKKEAILEVIEEKEKKPKIIIDEGVFRPIPKYEYDMSREEYLYEFQVKGGPLSRSLVRRLNFEEPVETTLVNKTLSEDIETSLSEIIQKEFSEELPLTERTEIDGMDGYATRFRARLDYKDSEGKQTSKWISTSRRLIDGQEDFEDFVLPEFMSRISELLNSYLKEATSSISISEIDIETEIPA